MPDPTQRGAQIAFRAVAKRYGAVEALAAFTLDVQAGEFVTFLGPSGSGKTTALNILAGFTDPSAGEVMIDAAPITALPPEKRNIGMVFQSYSLFPHLTVRDNVAFPLRMRGMARAERLAQAEQALEMVQLGGLGGRMPAQLSGGQRQRVALARAVVFAPRVLLMDEPLGALDLKLREAMQLEIKALQRRIGCTVIYVTHDQGEALTMSDRIVVMRDGRIEQHGIPQAIYDHPVNRFVAAFIGETNMLAAERAGTQLRVPSLGTDFAAPDSLAPGWRGEIALRPESLVRAGRPDAGPIEFPARIAEATFRGDIVRYAATAPAGASVVFHEARRFGATPLAEGADVTLSFAPHQAAFLADTRIPS